TTTTAAAPATAGVTTGARTSFRPRLAPTVRTQLARERTGTRGERCHVDAVRRRERHLVERLQQLPQITQRRVGPRALDNGETLGRTERFVGFGNRPRQCVSQSLGGSRRDGFGLSGREPALVGDFR